MYFLPTKQPYAISKNVLEVLLSILLMKFFSLHVTFYTKTQVFKWNNYMDALKKTLWKPKHEKDHSKMYSCMCNGSKMMHVTWCVK